MPQARLATNKLTTEWIHLIAAIGVIAALWLGVLPQIGTLAGVRRYIDRNERLGIDPSVKFYSELPAMPSILSKIEGASHREFAAFGGGWRSEGDPAENHIRD